jgi:hypothetical protein
MKKIIALIAFGLLPFLGMSQSGEKTFHLKNGSVVTGIVMEEVPGQEYKVKTADGNIFVFRADEIEKIVLVEAGKAKEPKSGETVADGISFYSLNGLSLAGMFDDDEASYNFGISSINGISLNNRLQVGLGLEYQIIADGGYFPIFLDTRFNFSKSSNTVFAYMNAGVVISNHNETLSLVYRGYAYDQVIRYDNSFLARVGVGYKTEIADKLNGTISLFYAAQGYSANTWLYDEVYFYAEGMMSILGLKIAVEL